MSKDTTLEIVSTLLLALRTSSALRFTILAGVFYHIVLGASGFEQLWLVQERGFERSNIAQIVGWIGVFAGLSGNLIGGLLSDWWQENTDQGRPMFLFWLALLTLPIGIYYRFVEPGSYVFWIGIIIGYFQLGCFFGPTFSTVQELVPDRIRATVVAFYILTLNLIGLTIGSWGGGVVADWMVIENYQEPYTMMLVVFSIISVISIPCYYLAGKRYKKDKVLLDEVFNEARS